MLKIEHTEVMGWEHAIRGMRNPMNSWEKSDSGWKTDCTDQHLIVDSDYEGYFELGIGPNDRDLMMRLAKSGPVHAKYRRMITVYVDINAPLYWWKEFDTYKVGTVTNSCSTMHKIHEKEFTLEDFSCEHLIDFIETKNGACLPNSVLGDVITALNTCRDAYLEARDENISKLVKRIGLDVWDTIPGDSDETKRSNLANRYWWQMIQLLPSSYNQKRTVMLNYEVLANIYKSRRNHKLDEWRTFCDWIEELPYSEVITGYEED